jgi:hypothetical protein
VSSHLHLKQSFSYVISEIHPQGSNQLKVVAQDKSKKGSKEGNSEKRQTASQLIWVLMLFNIILF